MNHGVRRGAAALAATALLGVSACTGQASNDDVPTPGASSQRPAEGGTLAVLTSRTDVSSLDPQQVTGLEDTSLLGAFVHRTLVRYSHDPDPGVQSSVVPDLAMDVGQANGDLTEWSFRLRDDARWADGDPITCADVKYGVSRQFAPDVGGWGTADALGLLDIPQAPDGTPAYGGPYSAEGQDLFDEAVRCDGDVLTFRLSRPTADFNETTTRLSFSPVRADRDIGAEYGQEPLASGPYEVAEYEPGNQLVLRRHGNWTSDSDPLRPAYPDEVVVQFDVPGDQVASRIAGDVGSDQAAVSGEPIAVDDVASGRDAFEGRLWDEAGQVATMALINTQRLPELESRQAIVAALDREELVATLGGPDIVSSADGLVAPGLALDYSPTGLWDGLLGAEIPPTGDAATLAQPREGSDVAVPALTVDYPDSEDVAVEVGVLISSLSAAGVDVEPRPLDVNEYYQVVLDPDERGHLSWLPWRPVWANASTVIPSLVGAEGAFNLSGVNQSGGVGDPELQAIIDAALTELDRQVQADLWQQANHRAMELGLAVPLTFQRLQRSWGSRVGGAYFYAPLESFAYADLYVTSS
jgi:peptide/nickel transport system substrate-binding protein